MALDANDAGRITRRIDELKDSVDKRFREIEDRRTSIQMRAAVVLIIAMYMGAFYALGRLDSVNDPGAACESGHPTTSASPP